MSYIALVKINHAPFGQSPVQSTLNSPILIDKNSQSGGSKLIPPPQPPQQQQQETSKIVVAAPSTGPTTFYMNLKVYSSKRQMTVSFPFDLE
jgi:hypothetical protein